MSNHTEGTLNILQGGTLRQGVISTPKSSGVERISFELTEIEKRISFCSSKVAEASAILFGHLEPPEPSNVGRPTADTVDGKLGDIRHVLSTLETSVAKLHQV